MRNYLKIAASSVCVLSVICLTSNASCFRLYHMHDFRCFWRFKNCRSYFTALPCILKHKIFHTQ